MAKKAARKRRAQGPVPGMEFETYVLVRPIPGGTQAQWQEVSGSVDRLRRRALDGDEVWLARLQLAAPACPRLGASGSTRAGTLTWAACVREAGHRGACRSVAG